MRPDDHPSDTELATFLRGLLEPQIAQVVEAHLGDCVRCCERLDALPSGPLDQLVRRAWDDTPNVATGREPAASLLVPGYEVLEELGRGGMGVVYRARQRSLNRVVALKLILGGPYADPEARARFRSEAELLARLHHPNIVQVHEAGVHDGQPYLVLEYVEGGSLSRRLADARQAAAGLAYTPRQAAELVETLARAVQHAHECGVVHRDLKPANVLLLKEMNRQVAKDAKKTGERENSDTHSPLSSLASLATWRFVPKITDFGLARELERTGSDHTAVAGTPSYMGPEQVQGSAPDIGAATDVYALGAVLYEMLTGRPPFLAVTSLATMHQVLHAEPVPPRRLQPGLPRDLETVCLKCLEKSPSRRYRTALGLAEDLRAFLDRRPIRARPVGPVGRSLRWARRQPLLAALWTAVVLVTAVGVGSFVWAYSEALHQRGVADERRKAATAAQYASQLTLLQRNLAEGLLGESEQLLEACPPEARGWEYRHFLSLMREQMRTLGAHRGKALDVVVSPDGLLLASTGEDGRVRLWETATGREVRGLHEGEPVSALAFVPATKDQPLRLAGATRRAVYLWNPATGRALRTIPTADTPAPVLAAGDDGASLAVVTPDHAVRVLDPNNGAELGVFRGHRDRITAVAFGRPGLGRKGRDPLLAASSLDGTVRGWDLKTQQVRFTVAGHQGAVRAVAFQPADSGLASTDESTEGRSLRLIDPDIRTPTGAIGGTAGFLPPQPAPITSLAFSPDGRRLATSSEDGVVRLWHLPTRSMSQKFQGHRESCLRVRFAPDGRTLISAGAEGTVRLWRLERQTGYRSWTPAARAEVVGVGFAGETSELVTVSSAGQVTRSGRTSPTFGVGGPVRAAACASAGWVLCLRADGTVSRGDTRLGEHVPLPGQAAPYTCVACTPRGDRFAAGDRDGVVTVWNEHGEVVRSVSAGDRPLTCVTLSSDGDTLATGEERGGVRLWQTSSGRKVGRVPPGAAPIGSLAFGAGDRLLAAGAADGMVHLHDRQSGQTESLIGHGGGAVSVAFSPDGTRLLTGGADRTLRLWDTATRQQVLVLQPQGPAVVRVAWSDDGHSVAAALGDGSVRTWSDAIDPGP